MTMPTNLGELEHTDPGEKDGSVFVTNRQPNKIQLVKIDPNTGKVLNTFGDSGPWPGQFGDIGGLSQDAQGRIYVADRQQRVIQRFTPDGKIDAIWWATRPGSETELEREGGQ